MRQAAKGGLRAPFVLSRALTVLPALALTLGLAGGCADVTGGAVQQDLDQLRRDLNAVTLSVHRSRGETEAVLADINRRTRDQAGDTTRQLGTLSTRIDALGADLGRVSARLDDVSQRLDVLNRRLAAQPPPPVASRSPAAPPDTPAVPAPPPHSAPEGSSAEQAYQSAYLDFTKGNYMLAVSSFREFIRRFPDAPLADDAQYWIGESYYSLGRSSATLGQADKATQALEQAVQEFRKLVLNYPRGDKVPTAIYKEALALLELKQSKVAQERLRYLIDHFPQSQEAPLAKERLAAISG